MSKILGIYKIANTITNQVYIGESMDIERRWEEHISDLKVGNHHSCKLQQSFNEYGLSSFEFEKLEYIESFKNISTFKAKAFCLWRESFYIHKYNSIELGFNIDDTLTKILEVKDLVITGKHLSQKMG